MVDFKRYAGAAVIGLCLCGQARAASEGKYWPYQKYSCAVLVSWFSAETAARNSSRGGSSNIIYTPNYALAYTYVAGWLDAYNALTPDTYDIVPNGGLDGAMLWLDNFCTKNPLTGLDEGLQALVAEAYPTRRR